MNKKGITLVILGVLLMGSVLLFFMEEEGLEKPCYDRNRNIIDNTLCYTTGDDVSSIGAFILTVSLLLFFGGFLELI